MNDDTLREECEAQLFYLSQLSRTDSPVDALMAFARAQQAKGLREAAELIEASMKPGAAMPMREQMIDYLKAQATARESHLHEGKS